MEEHLDVWPHLVDCLFAAQFEHPHEYAHHPRRHPRDVGDILPQCGACYKVALYLEVAEQCHLLLRHAHKVGQRVDVLYQYCAQVADKTFFPVVVRRMTATEYEPFTVEHAAVGIVPQVESHRVEAPGIVHTMQPLMRHGDEFRLVVGRPRRLCIPFHRPRPQHVALTVAHAVDVVLQLLVGVHRRSLRKIVVSPHAVEAMTASVFCCAALTDKPSQHLLLQKQGFSMVALKIFLTCLER